jgi:hypothetical protein
MEKECKCLYDMVKKSYIIGINICKYVYDSNIKDVVTIKKNHRYLISCTRKEYAYISTLLSIPDYISEEGLDKYHRIESAFVDAQIKSDKEKNKSPMMECVSTCKSVRHFIAEYCLKDLCKITRKKFENMHEDSISMYNIITDILDILQDVHGDIIELMCNTIEDVNYMDQSPFDYSYKVDEISDNIYDVLYSVKDKIGLLVDHKIGKLEKCSTLFMELQEAL